MSLFLDPKSDFIFKKLMEDENLLLDFLQSTLGNSEGTLVSAYVTDPSMKREFIKDKHSILDVRVKTSDGREINIEIQNRNEKNMSKRTLFHWSKMYSEQIVEGENYKRLRKTICINILNFNYLAEENFHNVYRLLNTNSKKELIESTLEIHFIELLKYEENKDLSDNEGLKAWVEFLNHPESTLTDENPIIKKAVRKLEVLSADKETRELYKLRQSALLEGKLAYNSAQSEKAEAIALNLIKAGLEDSFIAENTDLSIYEVRLLRKSIES